MTVEDSVLERISLGVAKTSAGVMRPGPGEIVGSSLADDLGIRNDAKIVIVDDEPLNVEGLEAFLAAAGYANVVSTSDTKGVQDLLFNEQPDVVLLDPMMPPLDGFDILAWMRTEKTLRHVPVIILTSATDAETKLRALELGATDFLAKPVDASELALRLRNTLVAKIYHDRLAYFDSLTGLPNRERYLDCVDWALRYAKRYGTVGAVLQVGVDRFKQINEALGPAIGDHLLRAVALRLQQCVRETDFIARWRAQCRDRRVAPGRRRIHGAAAGHGAAGERCHRRTADPGHECRPLQGGFARGVRHLPHRHRGVPHRRPDQGHDPAGRGCRDAPREARRRWLQVLFEGSERQVPPWAEPGGRVAPGDRAAGSCVFTTSPRSTSGRACCAAPRPCVRWLHPTRGLVNPEDFVPVAEETGLIIGLGDWVLAAACGQLKAWRAHGLAPPRIAVNLSSLQFRQRRLAQTVRDALANAGVEPGDLSLELTESAIMDGGPENIVVLNELKEIGVGLSIDDFGTGYSSLSHLKRFPLDEIKIDRAFLADVTSDRDNAGITIAIIRMGHSLGLRVVAEGVETAEQLAFVRAQDCDEAQGFLFGRPMLAEEFGALLQTHGLPPCPPRA